LEKVGTRCTPDVLRQLMTDAQQAAMDALHQISSGHIEPRPRDEKKCKWCDYRDICRVEETAAVLRAGGGQE